MALPWPQNHFGVFVVGKPKEHYHVFLFFAGGEGKSCRKHPFDIASLPQP